MDKISTGRPKWGTRDPLSDVNQQNTISQQEAMTHSVQNRPSACALWLFFAAGGHTAVSLDGYSSPLAFFSPFAAICFPCCQCLQDTGGKQILVEESEADLKLDSKGSSCPFHLTKCTFCYHSETAQVVITEYLMCLRLPVSKGTIG